MDSRLVIFTADDFGLSPALNAAVGLAHRQGVLTSASLMPGAPAASHALALARELPRLCLGVHLTLIQGRAVLPPRLLPDLVDQRGQFPVNPVATGWRYFFRPGLLPQIRAELAAQIETVLKAGLTAWCLNSHLNLHLHPRLLPLVIDLAREYGIPTLRLAREEVLTTLTLAPDRPLPKLAQGLIFRWLSLRARRLLEAAGLKCTDRLFGLTNDGRMTEGHLLGLIPRLRPGVTEIYSHPALYEEAELTRLTPAYRRREELTALLSPRVREALTRHGVKLTDFRQLAGSGPAFPA